VFDRVPLFGELIDHKLMIGNKILANNKYNVAVAVSLLCSVHIETATLGATALRWAYSPQEERMKSLLKRLVREEAGQDLIEYGLLIGLITAGAIAAISSIGPKVESYYTFLDGQLTTK
jgi:pilus assembly protein Flp/PilA